VDSLLGLVGSGDLPFAAAAEVGAAEGGAAAGAAIDLTSDGALGFASNRAPDSTAALAAPSAEVEAFSLDAGATEVGAVLGLRTDSIALSTAARGQPTVNAFF
jgi:hypothetical protein